MKPPEKEIDFQKHTCVRLPELWNVLKVMIMAGKEKGMTGIVSKVVRKGPRPVVIVEGRNLVRVIH